MYDFTKINRRLFVSISSFFALFYSFFCNLPLVHASYLDITNIPEALPYTFEGVTYTKLLAVQYSSYSVFFYANSESSIKYESARPTSSAVERTVNSSFSSAHFAVFICSSATSCDSPYTQEVSTTQYENAGEKIYTVGFDLFDITDEVFLGTRAELNGTSLIVPQLSNTNNLNYVSVPDPITNPSGFVSAVLTNFGIALVSWVVPPDNYFFTKVIEVENTWSVNQPGLSSINTAFSEGVTSLSSPAPLSPITIGSLHIGSTSTSAISFFDPSFFSSSIFDSAKTLISAFMYFGVAFWVVRQVSTIMSS